TADGTLHAADDVRKPQFIRLGQAPGATKWDAAGDVVVAGADKRAFVSTDGGRHFEVTDVAESVWDVFARKDGLAVVVPFQRWPRVSKDGGRTWIDPPPQPPDNRPRADRRCPPGGLFGSADKNERWGNCWTPLLPPHFVRAGDWIGTLPGVTGG